PKEFLIQWILSLSEPNGKGADMGGNAMKAMTVAPSRKYITIDHTMTNRRDFIQKSILSTTGIAVGGMGFSAKSYANIIGANETVNVAVIGIHGMGQSHIREYSKLKNARVIALCDVDSNLFAERVKKLFTDKGVAKPKTYIDLRKLYEDRDV